MAWRCKVDFDTLPWISPIPGVREKFLVQNGVKLRLVEYAQSMAPHWCSKGHAGQILAGEFEIQFDQGIELLNAGDAVLIPAGDAHRHRARALSETVTALFAEKAE